MRRLGVRYEGMQLHHRRTEDSAFLENELRMQREAYERAGADAYVLGVPRNANPYVRRPDAYSDPDDQKRLQRLAEHWWNGWDSASAKLRAPRRRG